MPSEAASSSRSHATSAWPHATQVSRHPRSSLGWIGGSGQCALLSRSIGASNAAQMVLTGDPVDADTALAWGLITKLVDPGDLVAVAMEVAKTIALRAPIAAETAKANLRATWDLSIDAAVDYERRLQTICFATKDAAEGRAAFRETPLHRHASRVSEGAEVRWEHSKVSGSST